MNNNIITNGKQPLHAYSQALTNLNLRTKQQIQTDQRNTKNASMSLRNMKVIQKITTKTA